MICIEDYVGIFVNGVLLSRRMIKNDSGTPITRSDVSSCKLNVYTLTYDTSGNPTRTVVTGWSDLTIPINDIITATLQTDSSGSQYNFGYCVEGAFTLPRTSYCVEYTLTMSDTHKVIIPVYARTMN